MWISIDQTPPDEYVRVTDSEGNIGIAQPTYHPFKVGKSLGSKWSSPVISCEPYWDGGWLVLAPPGSLSSKVKTVVAWQPIPKTP